MLEIVHESPVPRQEETGKMDLRGKRVRVSPLADRRDANHDQKRLPTGSNPYVRRRNLIECLAKGSSEKVIHYTVEVRTVGIDGRNLGDGHVQRGFQTRLVRNLAEALQRDQRSPSKLLLVTEYPPSPQRPILHALPRKWTSTRV